MALTDYYLSTDFQNRDLPAELQRKLNGFFRELFAGLQGNPAPETVLLSRGSFNVPPDSPAELSRKINANLAVADAGGFSTLTFVDDPIYGITWNSTLALQSAMQSLAGELDTAPSAFTFTDVTGATTATVYTSNTITLAGMNAAAAITITGGTYSINGGAFVSTAGSVVNNDTVRARVTSSGSASTAVNAVVTIGGVSDTYTVTTT